jgi:hypothetical protein
MMLSASSSGVTTSQSLTLVVQIAN